MVYTQNILYKIKKRDSDSTITATMLQPSSSVNKLKDSQKDLIKALGGN